MTYDEFVDFIQNRMTRSHVYQPVLIGSLVDAGGRATLSVLDYRLLQSGRSPTRCLTAIDREFFGLPLRDGIVVPDHPDYRSIKEDESMVFMRGQR